MPETIAKPIDPSATMEELLIAVPGARRALFRLYHIGGCSSCGFRPEETLEQVCERNDNLPAAEVLERVLDEAKKEAELLIDPVELASALLESHPPTLVDIRTEEEFQAVSLPKSRLLNQSLLQEILGTWKKDDRIVLIDHAGERSLDAAAYFLGHGMTNIKALRGGIDAWSLEVDPALPRYLLE